MKNHPTLGIIGGSGLYEIPDLKKIEKHKIRTPFGEPSSPIMVGTLKGKRLAFLARHGIGHTLNPSEVNYRANIYALKTLGVERIVSVSACGSLREDYVPGDIVIPDQLFDFTRGRERSFFEGGLVAHIGVADPFCEDLSPQIHSAVKSTKAKVHSGGNFITIEGPRFSTRAESNVYRTWGMDLIGMTTSPEAFLAREAEMCYGVMAHITDYDVWHISEAPVTADMVFETIKKNTSIAQEAIVNLAANLDNNMTCNCHNALAEAFTTQPKNASSEKRKDLSLLLNKYWK